MEMDHPRLVAARDARLEALGPRPPWWRLFARRRWNRECRAVMAMSVSVYTALLRSIYTPESIYELSRTHPALSIVGKAKSVSSVVSYIYDPEAP